MYRRIASLGQTCVCAYQIDLFHRVSALRQRRPASKAERFLFDWRVTPLSAVVAAIEADFVGQFEREDLVVREGMVVHRTLKTKYVHEFEAVAGELSEAAIDQQFEAARDRHDHLSRKMQALVRSSEPTLYALSGKPNRPLQTLLDVLSRHSEHRFHVALFLAADVSIDLPDDARVSRQEISAPVQKSEDRAWEGDDTTWLRGFNTLVLQGLTA